MQLCHTWCTTAELVRLTGTHGWQLCPCNWCIAYVRAGTLLEGAGLGHFGEGQAGEGAWWDGCHMYIMIWAFVSQFIKCIKWIVITGDEEKMICMARLKDGQIPKEDWYNDLFFNHKLWPPYRWENFANNSVQQPLAQVLLQTYFASRQNVLGAGNVLPQPALKCYPFECPVVVNSFSSVMYYITHKINWFSKIHSNKVVLEGKRKCYASFDVLRDTG